MAATISLRGVEVRAPDGSSILRGLDLEVGESECVALIGRSGAGKSTALRLVNGLVTAHRGEVVVLGERIDAHDLVALRRRVGYVIQQIGLLPHVDVRANVAIVPRLLGWTDADVTARVDEVLTLVGLSPAKFGARRPSELSGGERQRVGVARALAARPTIVLMDEPFGAADPLLRVELQRDVREVTRKLGTSVLLVTHDLREAFIMADRVALLDEGRIAFVGTPRAFARSDHPVARAYVESITAIDGALDDALGELRAAGERP
jgi:osmoprotectant transport system ATP-binding protein